MIMKNNILVVIAILFFTSISSVNAQEISDVELGDNILSDIFDTFGWDTEENISLVEELLKEYNDIDWYNFDDSEEFKELQEFMQATILK